MQSSVVTTGEIVDKTKQQVNEVGNAMNGQRSEVLVHKCRRLTSLQHLAK